MKLIKDILFFMLGIIMVYLLCTMPVRVALVLIFIAAVYLYFEWVIKTIKGWFSGKR